MLNHDHQWSNLNTFNHAQWSMARKLLPMALGWWVYGISGVIALRYLNVPMFSAFRCVYARMRILMQARSWHCNVFVHVYPGLCVCDFTDNLGPSWTRKFAGICACVSLCLYLFRRFTTIIVMVGEYKLRGRLPPRNQQVASYSGLLSCARV